MPRETLERIAAQLGSLDGEPLQARCLKHAFSETQLHSLLTMCRPSGTSLGYVGKGRKWQHRHTREQLAAAEWKRGLVSSLSLVVCFVVCFVRDTS